jgi:hypothetical protein
MTIIDTELNDILVSQEETTRRLSFCMTCESNVLDVIPKCKECNCSLSMVTTLNFKTCPLEKW